MRMRFVALVALSLVLTIIWYSAAFKPARKKLGEVRADVTRTEAEVATLTAKLAELQELKRNEKQLREEFAKYREALPVEPAVSDFILDVQEAADQSGIDFLSIAPSIPTTPSGGATAAPAAAAPAPSASPSAGDEAQSAAAAPVVPAQPAAQAVSVSLTADGSFFEIETFIAKMEKLKRAIRVDNFSLSGAGGDTAATGAAAPAAGASGSPGVSLSIKLQMFMNRVAAPAAPAATTPTTTTGAGS